MDSEAARKQSEHLEREIETLGKASPGGETDRRIEELRGQLRQLQAELSGHASAWSRVQLARHPQRPQTLDYVKHLFQDFTEIHGDRTFGDDPALVAGMAWFHGRPVIVVGHQKGHDTTQKVQRNFGMPKPEGYRKALRVMQLAAKFRRPIFTFVDTPGAYPGIDSEERGQAEAIARNLREMARIAVPIVVTITGEGGSGGALAIAVGDRILMLENAVYSVISPEGCASITWRDSTKAEQAAEALKITALDLKPLGIVDEIVPEPPGGAHTDPQKAAQLLDPVLEQALRDLCQVPVNELLQNRYQKFRLMGQFFREAAAS
ncbi:MAG: acetyl-CoA carboxylase carboxyltransferase subunit alpha [Acidobacteria bacterium RIFCSPLOWO2_02_FULL_61_28]|nr:MAG: acetyl-CoA carboxylase carboxyltransferase subunit alpha [Acidobacteria bacterium RIFCSPLOWO2_02_FULL_61_28]